jgi:CRP/FNR family transcriptional regulator, dissimilatory nitrate respiration regulator
MKEIKKSARYQELLFRTFLFRSLEKNCAEELFQSPECFCAQFQAEEKIYTRSTFLKCMGLVLTGELKAVKAASGDSPLVLNTFHCGGIFGVAGLFNGSDAYVSEIVAVKQSRVLFLSQKLLHDFFMRQPLAAENYISFLSGRICFLNSCIDHFTGGRAERRLAEFLLSCAALNGKKKIFSLPYSMTRLSDTLGIGRASLYRVFDVLAREGLVRRDGKTVEIIDAERLRAGHF